MPDNSGIALEGVTVASTKYSDIVSEVLPFLAADPSDPVTEHAIKRSVIEFCNRSWVWKYFPDLIDVTAGTAAYDLEPPQGAEITTVMTATLNGFPLDAKTPDWLDRNSPGWKTTQLLPKFYTQVDTEQIILAAVPDQSYPAGLDVTLALQPDQRATSFPKWIQTQYLYTITAGAISTLMLMSAKNAWADPILGKDYRNKFENGIADARSDAVSALGRAPVRVRGQH